MVSAVRRGVSQRRVARKFRVGLATVQLWVERASGQRLDRFDWSDRSSAPRRPRRTPRRLEDRILALRRELAEESALGEYGARAIREALLARPEEATPSLRTIGRILSRRGVLDANRRIRRPPPPRGWYLPDVAAGEAELDSFDMVSGLVIEDGPEVEVFNGVSLHGGLVASWPGKAVTAETSMKALLEHWRAWGLPAYAQFDNDTRFQGPHHMPDVVGRVIRLCLSLGVVPVFAPPQETGFQAAIESYNGRWQSKVWSRFHHPSLSALRARSKRYVEAHRQRHRQRVEGAPERRPFPARWKQDLRAPLEGRMVYLRRTDEKGRLSMLGHRFEVDAEWKHRLVRVEVDLDRHELRVFALRRRTPEDQPLLATIPHQLGAITDPKAKRKIKDSK